MKRWIGGFVYGLVLAATLAIAADVKWSSFSNYSPTGGVITGVGLQDGANVKFPSAFSRLASGEILSPVNFLDIPLQGSGNKYLIQLADLTYSGAEQLYACVSTDGGMSFINDATNSDTYAYGSLSNIVAYNGGAGSGTNSSTVTSADALFVLGANRGNYRMGFIYITPGSLTRSFMADAYINVEWPGGSPAGYAFGRALAWFNPFSTISTTLATINVIRLLPYGSGDCNTPLGMITITAGKWSVLSVPYD